MLNSILQYFFYFFGSRAISCLKSEKNMKENEIFVSFFSSIEEEELILLFSIAHLKNHQKFHPSHS